HTRFSRDWSSDVCSSDLEVGTALVSHPEVAKVSLTGSVGTGKRVLALAGEHMKHATMELGGKSPLIVFDDADVENAVSGAMLGRSEERRVGEGGGGRRRR